MERIKLSYICFLNQSGYSQAAQDIIFALHETGKYDIALHGLHSTCSTQAVSKNRSLLIKEMTGKRHSDAVQIYHTIPPMQTKIKRLSKTIGFGTFETFDPPKIWIDILNSNNAVIVPSMFNKRVFENSGINKPIFYVPHTIDVGLFNPKVKKNKSNKFTFMFFGQWKKRKGWQHLIEAWITEFGPKDDVRLLIKTDKPDTAKKEIERHKKNLGLSTKENAPILFESKVFDEFELPRFMKQADCLISPTMGEGFGLPVLQCMALGVPVIITNFSGCQDYANSQTAILLEPSGFVLLNGMDDIPQFKEKKWAYVPVESIRRSMRYVLSNADKVKEKADYAASYVAERFNRSIAVKAFDTIMDQI